MEQYYLKIDLLHKYYRLIRKSIIILSFLRFPQSTLNKSFSNINNNRNLNFSKSLPIKFVIFHIFRCFFSLKFSIFWSIFIEVSLFVFILFWWSNPWWQSSKIFNSSTNLVYIRISCRRFHFSLFLHRSKHFISFGYLHKLFSRLSRWISSWVMF